MTRVTSKWKFPSQPPAGGKAALAPATPSQLSEAATQGARRSLTPPTELWEPQPSPYLCQKGAGHLEAGSVTKAEAPERDARVHRVPRKWPVCV